MLKVDVEVPLVVDLDNALLRSDPLVETFFLLLATDARALAKLPGWLAKGRDRLRLELTARTRLDAELLPYDHAMVEYLRSKRANGRRLVLVSAANREIVDRFAASLGLFDEVHGSTPDRCLTGAARAEFIAERFGEGRFDYVGKRAADWPTWLRARRVITVNAAPLVRSRADRDFADVEHLPSSRESSLSRLGGYIAALRPHQWVKNLLVFVPLVAAHEFQLRPVVDTSLAFIAFCLAASSVYILNDFLDLPHDRKHLRKKSRPLASGRIRADEAVALTLVLVVASLWISVGLLNLPFLGILGLYYTAALCYSLKLKRIPTIDMIMLAGLYTTRIVGGGVAPGVPHSAWLLALSMFIFLALAAVKRQSELMDLAKRDRKQAAGRGYVVDDLPMITSFGISAGYIAVLVLALYINTPDVDLLYHRPLLLWAACPLLLYWISRMFMKAHRGEIHDDPIVFAFRDRVSWLTGAAIGAVVIAATVPWP